MGWERFVLLASLAVLVLGTLWLLTPSPSPPRRPMLEEATHSQNTTWDQLMDSHLKDRSADRVVLCRWAPGDGDGLCNRMTHAASCLLLAMLTKRTLILDWPNSEFRWNSGDNEYVGIEPFSAIFKQTPWISVWSDVPHQRKCKQLNLEDTTLLTLLKEEDPASLFSDAPCIQMSTARRFWGGILTHNSHVRQGPPAQAFSTIARRTLAPLPSDASWTNSTAEGCEWLIQYRARAQGKWEKVPSLPAFLECGRLHGMRSPRGVLLLSDQEQSNSPAMKSAPLSYCRHLPGCDRDTVHLMHFLGSCKRMLISDYSSFGQCVAGLSNIKHQWVVHTTHDGAYTCVRKYDLAPSWRMSDFVPEQRADPRLANF